MILDSQRLTVEHFPILGNALTGFIEDVNCNVRALLLPYPLRDYSDSAQSRQFKCDQRGSRTQRIVRSLVEAREVPHRASSHQSWCR